MPTDPFAPLPISGIAIPRTPLLEAALEHTRQHMSPAVTSHCLRVACFALLVRRKSPAFAGVDAEVLALAGFMHDFGWTTTPSLRSADRRFEVDGGEQARAFVRAHPELAPPGEWGDVRLQRLWDAIALHTTPSIALYKEPDVANLHLGVGMEFFGPGQPGSLVTEDEYKEILAAHPFMGFREEMKGIMCGLCRDKKKTTFDNFVSSYGIRFGLDGKGGGKEEFAEECAARHTSLQLDGSLKQLAMTYGE